MITTTAAARNFLIGAGAYYCSRWLAAFLMAGLGTLARRFVSSGGLAGGVTNVLVGSLANAIGAASAGVAVVLLVEGRRRGNWTLVPAGLWVLGALSEAPMRSPLWSDYVGLIIAAALPAIMCVGSGRIAERHRRL